MSELGFEIPRKCASCPHVLESLFDYAGLSECKMSIEEEVVTGGVENVAQLFTSQTAEFGLPITVDANLIEVKIRQAAARTLDELDGEMAKIEDDLRLAVTGCSGLLRMRAKRGRVTYTAAICGSPLAPTGDSIEPTIVNRQVEF